MRLLVIYGKNPPFSWGNHNYANSKDFASSMEQSITSNNVFIDVSPFLSIYSWMDGLTFRPGPFPVAKSPLPEGSDWVVGSGTGQTFHNHYWGSILFMNSPTFTQVCIKVRGKDKRCCNEPNASNQLFKADWLNKQEDRGDSGIWRSLWWGSISEPLVWDHKVINPVWRSSIQPHRVIKWWLRASAEQEEEDGVAVWVFKSIACPVSHTILLSILAPRKETRSAGKVMKPDLTKTKA